MDLDQLRNELRVFAERRDWERFHTPKNLTMALAGETGELIEVFQWLTEEESAQVMEHPQRTAQVRDELADVFLYLTRLADVLGVDLLSVAAEKLERNEQRYPAEQVKGRAVKWSELAEEP